MNRVLIAENLSPRMVDRSQLQRIPQRTKYKGDSMRMTTKYTVLTQHRLPQYNGIKTAHVTDNGDGTKFVKMLGFGCSRNYRTESDEQAIRNFLSEHSATLTEIL